MSDLINRADVIDALWKALHDYEDKIEKQFLESDVLDVGDWIEHRIFVQNMSDIDRQIIRDWPSAQQWTPCSEGTPEKEGWYFVTVHPDYIVPDSRHTDSLYWLDGKWWFYDYDARMAVWTDPIIAWMPLPKAYREEGD